MKEEQKHQITENLWQQYKSPSIFFSGFLKAFFIFFFDFLFLWLLLIFCFLLDPRCLFDVVQKRTYRPKSLQKYHY